MAKSPTKVVTGKVRLTYVHLFEPWSMDVTKQEPKYSVCILIPKSDTKTIAALRQAEKAAADAGIAKFGGTKPKNLKLIIHDGDTDAELDKNPERAGHWYMSVSAKQRPGVVDRNVQPIIEPSDIYSGCYGRVSLNAYAYSVNGNKGISFGLNNVQKLEDGDPLGNITLPEDDFDALDDETDASESLI